MKKNHLFCISKKLLFLSLFIVLIILGLWFIKNGNFSYKSNAAAIKTRRNQTSPTVVPTYPPQPNAPDFGLGFWIALLNKLPDTQKQLGILEKLVPDPLVRSRIAEVLIGNQANYDTATRWLALKLQGKVVGLSLCGDSRVICDTNFKVTGSDDFIAQTAYYGLDGGNIVIEEQRSLGAAPRIFSKGINYSMVAVHSNCLDDPNGCGARKALEILNQPSGREKLLHEGVDQSTIDEIQRTLFSTDIDEAAKLGANIQAKINFFEHGERHITVAIKMGHADGSMEILGAYDQMGKIDEIPDVIKQFVFLHNQQQGAVKEYLKPLIQGQAPFEYVLDASGFNIQDLMDAKAAIPGHTFKITARPQISDVITRKYPSAKSLELIRKTRDVDQAIAGINYPLVHDWGRLQWIFAASDEDAAFIRNRMLMSDPAWKFLGRDGTIVEAIVGPDGKILNRIKITRLADFSEDIAKLDTAALRTVGEKTVEMTLSEKTLASLNNLSKEEEVVGGASKTTEFISGLKKAGKVTLKILKWLDPFFNATFAYYTYEQFREFSTWKTVYDIHTNYVPTKGINWLFDTIGRHLETYFDYNSPVGGAYDLIKSTYFAHPYVITKTNATVYTQRELAEAFKGLKNYWTSEVNDQSVGAMTNGSDDINSPFYHVGIQDLYQILNFDFYDKDIRPAHLTKLAAVGKPLIFFPIPNMVKKSYQDELVKEYDYDHLENHQFIILNLNSGELITTDTEGDMIVKTSMIMPDEKIPQDKNFYYMYLKSDGKGNISVTPSSYYSPSSGYHR